MCYAAAEPIPPQQHLAVSTGSWRVSAGGSVSDDSGAATGVRKWADQLPLSGFGSVYGLASEPEHESIEQS